MAKSKRAARRVRASKHRTPPGACLELLEDRRMLHALSTGFGDGSLNINVDGYGSFGHAINFPDEIGTAVYDPLDDGDDVIPPAETTFESGLAIRIGPTGPRQFLTSGNILGSGDLDAPEVSGSFNIATSLFEFQGLNFVLVQTVQSTFNDEGLRIGSVLLQTYEITNPTNTSLAFELIRYLDGDLLFDNSLVDGGGRLFSLDRDLLFETDAGGSAETETTFLGIDSVGGNSFPLDGRFEIDSFSGLGNRIIAGDPLDNFITGDGDGDGFIDEGSEYDVTLAMRNLFFLAPGGTVTYSTRTIFGSGTPGDPSTNIVDRVMVELGASVTKLEGDSGITAFVFEVHKLEFTSSRILVAYSTFDGSATAPNDYQTNQGTLTFHPAGSFTQFITVNVIGDNQSEPNESFTLQLTGVTRGLLSDRVAVGTILNDDPKVSIGDGAVFEGNADFVEMYFAVTLSHESVETVTVAYTTFDITATAPADYEAASGTLTFAFAEPRTQYVTVRVAGDLFTEANETFGVRLGNLSRGVLLRNEALGTILNDDVELTVADVTVVEGNSGTKNALFVVAAAGTVNRKVTVNYFTVDGTATAPSDYLPQGGAMTIEPGATFGTIAVPIVGDERNEGVETFTLVLATAANALILDNLAIGTIVDNDALPFFYVNDVQLTTTAAGVYAAVFTVALDVASGREITVRFETSDGSAINGFDYAGQTGMLTFAPGVTTRQVSVPVFVSGDPVGNKRFWLHLDGPSNALLSDALGSATIVFGRGPSGEYIVDNGNLGFSKTGTWTNLTNTLAYQLDYDYAAAGGASATATWTFSNIAHTSYQVFARWIPFSNRATNAAYTVLDGSTPLGTVTVNQQLAPAGDMSEGIAWQSLGIFTANSGALSVRLGNNANGLVIADAVRIVTGGIGAQTPEIDVAGLDRSITTGDDSPSALDATEFGAVAALTGTAARTFTIANHGNAPLNLGGSPPVAVGGAHFEDYSIVQQPAAVVMPGGKTTFEVLFKPKASGDRNATITVYSNDPDEPYYTFAIHGTGTGGAAQPIILDDAAGTFTAGWVSTPHGSAYLGQMRSATAGSGQTATFNFLGLAGGAYDIYATWVPANDRATNAPFTVSNLVNHSYTTTVNQKQTPGKFINGAYWGDLGTIDAVGGSLRVTLGNDANGVVVADAVLIVPSGFVPGQPPEPEPPVQTLLHNGAFPQDVNNDKRVTPHDSLLIINRILAQTTASAAPLAAATTTAGATSAATYYVDVNNDGRVTPHDMLLVFNYILRAQATGTTAGPLVAGGPGDKTLSGAEDALLAAAAAVDMALSEDEADDDPPAGPLVRNDAPARQQTATGAASGPLMLTPEGIDRLVADDDEADDDEALVERAVAALAL